MMGGMDSDRPTEPDLLSLFGSANYEFQDGTFPVEPPRYDRLLPDRPLFAFSYQTTQGPQLLLDIGRPYETPDGRFNYETGRWEAVTDD